MNREKRLHRDDDLFCPNRCHWQQLRLGRKSWKFRYQKLLWTYQRALRLHYLCLSSRCSQSLLLPMSTRRLLWNGNRLNVENQIGVDEIYTPLPFSLHETAQNELTAGDSLFSTYNLKAIGKLCWYRMEPAVHFHIFCGALQWACGPRCCLRGLRWFTVLMFHDLV